MKRMSKLMAAFFCLVAMFCIGGPAPVLAGDGKGCEGDIDGNGQVDVFDFFGVLGAFGQDCSEEPCAEDVNGDGHVNVLDFLIVLSNFGCGLQECSSPADCDDGDDATIDICAGGFCFHIPLPPDGE